MADRDLSFLSPWLVDKMLREADGRIRTAAIQTPGDHPIYESLVQIIRLISDAREALKEDL